MSFNPIGQTGQTLVDASLKTDGTLAGKGTSVGTPLSTSDVAAWLAKQRPADMDKAAVSRALSHGVGLEVRYEYRYPSGPNGEYLPSYSVAVGCNVAGSPSQRRAAAEDLRKFMTPASPRQIEGWIAELSVTVAKRQDDEFGEELRVTAYANRLIRYPADVARNALFNPPFTFFPTWAELEKRCSAAVGPRVVMIAALERGPEPEAPIRRPATQEERDRIQAMVDQMFPNQSDDSRRAAVDVALQGNCMTGAAQ